MKLLKSLMYAYACAIIVFSSCTKSPLDGKGVIALNVTAESLSTKGALITTTSIKSDPFGTFAFDAYLESEAHDNENGATLDKHYIQSAKAEYNSVQYSWDLDGDYYWVNEVPTHFWFYAPVSVNGSRTLNSNSADLSTASVMTFSYSLPTAQSMDGSNYIDANKQDDVVFAYAARTWEESQHTSHDYDKIKVVFYHALSWVRFMINVSDGSFDSALDIQSITINNVAAGGTCLFDPSQLANSDKFAWTPSTTTANYTQTLSKTDFTEAHKSGGYLTAGTQNFFMIPEALASDASVTVVFKRTDGTTVSRTASITGDTWKPGMYYTYRLNATALDDQITFTVTYVDWEDGGTGNLL